MQRKHPCQLAGGFTLVELLVVIAVISLLAALLVPTLRMAMGVTSVSQCRANNLNLVMAVQLYATEHDSSLPWNNWADKDEQWKVNCNAAGWLYDYPMAQIPEEVETGSLWQYTGSRKDYHCPRHDPPYTGPSEKLTSYMMNGAVSRYGYVAQVVPYKIHQMPTDGICFWEPESAALGGGAWNDGSGIPDEGATQRHHDGAVVSCFGGYTEWLSHTDYNTETSKKPGRLWCAPTPTGS